MSKRFQNSDAMCKRAQELIPGGAHTYSKGADQSPLLGPKLFERGKGSHIWDVDGNEYIDWSMGLASVSLGHAYEPVLDAVRAELPKGSNFQCPSPIETKLAELFIREVPSAQMVKFAKNGSTVTTAALKLARAHTGRKRVAYCSDHSFFSYDDWFIGTKPNNSGVPEEISALSVPFRYNDLASLEDLFGKYPGEIAGVILEPVEFEAPAADYLPRVKELCQREGALLILDEMITGFRVHYPGAHVRFGVEPDLTTWGKGIANGFSVCVLAGRREIMKLGGLDHDRERVFLISTTHGAETHSIAAAIATLTQIKQTDSIARNQRTGQTLRTAILGKAKEAGLEGHVTISGLDAWQAVQFLDHDRRPCDGFKTLAFQEFIKHGILFRGGLVPTISHSLVDIERTVEALGHVLETHRRAIEARDYRPYLVGDPVKPVFRKWN